MIYRTLSEVIIAGNAIDANQGIYVGRSTTQHHFIGLYMGGDFGIMLYRHGTTGKVIALECNPDNKDIMIRILI